MQLSPLMPLLVPLATLACYLLAWRGLLLFRGQPQLSLTTDADGEPGSGQRRGPGPVPLPAERRNAVAWLYDGLGRLVGPLLMELLGPRWRAAVRRYLDLAGHPRGYDVAGFAGLQGAYTTLAVSALLLLCVRGQVLLGAGLGLLLLIYPSVWLYSEGQRRQQLIERELPDFLDLLAITVSAGLGFRQALERVQETLSGPLAGEIRRVLNRLDAGVRRRQVFTELRERNDRSATMALFVTAILQAEELGVPLTDTLSALSHDMRREFAQQARRRAARAVPRVSLIITTVILPAVVGLILVALMLGSGASLKGL